MNYTNDQSILSLSNTSLEKHLGRKLSPCSVIILVNRSSTEDILSRTIPDGKNVCHKPVNYFNT